MEVAFKEEQHFYIERNVYISIMLFCISSPKLIPIKPTKIIYTYIYYIYLCILYIYERELNYIFHHPLQLGVPN